MVMTKNKFQILSVLRVSQGVVVIVWSLDLQLPMQSVPITTNVVSLNPTQVRYTWYNIMW